MNITTRADRMRRDAMRISATAMRRGDLAAAERALKIAERYRALSEAVWTTEGLRLRKRRLVAQRQLYNEDDK